MGLRPFLRSYSRRVSFQSKTFSVSVPAPKLGVDSLRVSEVLKGVSGDVEATNCLTGAFTSARRRLKLL